jgi:hypothetical protein
MKRIDPTNPSEAHEMKCLALWLNARFSPYGWIHVPNERILRAKDIPYYKSLLAQGLKPGFPDILVLSSPLTTTPHGLYAKGAAVELKRRHGAKPKENQLRWAKELCDLGYLTHVAYGYEDARKWLESIYGECP